MKAERGIFGYLRTGEPVETIEIMGGGLRARVLTLGAVIQDLRLDNHAPPLVLGFDSLGGYLNFSPWFGATAGRVANRIGGGKLRLGEVDHQLELNLEGVAHLHGGANGISRRLWTVVHTTPNSVVLQIVDPDGQAGYPGNCTITCTYTLKPSGVLNVVYESTSDRATICNICQHSYFNLDGAETALDHEIKIDADSYLETDEVGVPTGEVRSVANTVFDLRQLTSMRRQLEGERIAYDNTFCLSTQRGEKRSIATARSRASGVVLEVATTEPGVVFYTGSKLNIPVPGLENRSYQPFAGFCLETQAWPDACNHPNFPDITLRAQHVLRQETDYIFSKS